MATKKMNGTAKAIEEMGEVPDYRKSATLASSDLAALVKARNRYKEEKEAAESLYRDAGDQIAELLEKARLKAVICGKFRVTRIESKGASRLDKTRLIELGVSADLIVKAMIEGTPYVTVSIKEVGGDD
jgi:hypothetical protein